MTHVFADTFFFLAVLKQKGWWHALRLLSPLEVEDESQT